MKKEFPIFRKILPKNRKIVLYGAREYAQYTFNLWENDDRLIVFCCNNQKKQEEGYLGYPVISPDDLLSRKDLIVVINVVKEIPKGEIRQFSKAGEYPENQYFGPDFMKFGENEVFLDVGFRDLKSRIENIRKTGFADEIIIEESIGQKFSDIKKYH